MQDLKELLKKIISSDMEFVIIGGFAGVFHGATQVTQDIDICLSMDEKKNSNSQKMPERHQSQTQNASPKAFFS